MAVEFSNHQMGAVLGGFLSNDWKEKRQFPSNGVSLGSYFQKRGFRIPFKVPKLILELVNFPILDLIKGTNIRISNSKTWLPMRSPQDRPGLLAHALQVICNIHNIIYNMYNISYNIYIQRERYTIYIHYIYIHYIYIYTIYILFVIYL